MKKPYEVHNPSFNCMTLESQIQVGVNDWCAEGANGHPYFGRTESEAESIRASHENGNRDSDEESKRRGGAW